MSLSSPPVAGVWWAHTLDCLYVSLSSPPVAGVWWEHTLDWLYDSLSSPPVAGVWRAHTLDWLYDSLSSPLVAGVWWAHTLDCLYDSLSSPPVAGVWWAHTLDWLYDSLSSPPVAGVWWAHWCCCPVAAVVSSKWMLHTGGVWGETPHIIVKRFGCTAIHNVALYKCIIHSYIHTGVPQGLVLGPLLFSVYMASLGSVIQKHGFSHHCCDDDTQLYFSFHPDPPIAARISACLTDICCWMKDLHLQLNLAKTELLVVLLNLSVHHNFTFQLGTSTITPSKTARNLGGMIDDQLTFSDHIAKTTRSCRFDLFNIKKIRPWTCFTTLCSGSCSVQAGLLQCSLGRSSSQFY